MSKRLSTEARKIQANSIHHNKYDYSLWPSTISLNNTVSISCPTHGIFMQSIKNHIILGHGCRQCHNDRLGHTRKKTTSQFIIQSHQIHHNKYDYSEWANVVYSTSKVPIICPIHGKFKQTINSHLQGCGCPACKKDSISVVNKKNKTTFIDQCSIIHHNKYDYSGWDNAVYSTSKVPIGCPIHGEFIQTVNSHMSGRQGCPKCKVDRTKKTNMKKFGSSYWMNSHISIDTQNKLSNKRWLITQHHDNKKTQLDIASQLAISATTVAHRMQQFNITTAHYFTSKGELELQEYIRSFGVEIKTNDRTVISPHELDIYLPEYNLAFEYNGLFWHSERAGKNATYHLNKNITCERVGVRLVQIFEDEWRDYNDKCKSTIRHLLGRSPKGVFARNTTIKEIPWKQAKEFLDKYHLLNAGAPGNYRIGAFNKDNQLVGVMVFGRQNNEHSSKNVIELRRFVTDKNNNPGLGSKMFAYAISNKHYAKVIAFVDRRWFNGLVKDYIGFVKIHETKPTVWWTNGKDRHHRRIYTKQELIKITELPAMTSKREMMAYIGFYRIWDCGKIKLEFTS